MDNAIMYMNVNMNSTFVIGETHFLLGIWIWVKFIYNYVILDSRTSFDYVNKKISEFEYITDNQMWKIVMSGT